MKPVTKESWAKREPGRKSYYYSIEDKASLEDSVPSSIYFEDQVENKVLLELVLKRLDKVSLHLIHEIYIEGRTKKSVAKELHISGAALQYRLNRIANKAKKITA
jgi:DNA-directed RNA polymerase specialized sigma subunit